MDNLKPKKTRALSKEQKIKRLENLIEKIKNEPINKRTRKYRAKLLINFALMKLDTLSIEQKKKVDIYDFENDILTYIERRKPITINDKR